MEKLYIVNNRNNITPLHNNEHEKFTPYPFFVFAVNTHAQNPNFVWAKKFNGSETKKPFAVDALGNVYCSNGELTVYKLNAFGDKYGQKLWLKLLRLARSSP